MGDLHNSYVVNSGFQRLYFFITGKHGRLLVSHKAKTNNTATVVRNMTFTTHLNSFSSVLILPSCELYSFLVVYIWTFCFEVVKGLLLCILFHQFGLNWAFIEILCRVFCFWWNTSSSKRFVFSVTCIWYVFVPPPLLLIHCEQRRK